MSFVIGYGDYFGFTTLDNRSVGNAFDLDWSTEKASY